MSAILFEGVAAEAGGDIAGAGLSVGAAVTAGAACVVAEVAEVAEIELLEAVAVAVAAVVVVGGGGGGASAGKYTRIVLASCAITVVTNHNKVAPPPCVGELGRADDAPGDGDAGAGEAAEDEEVVEEETMEASDWFACSGSIIQASTKRVENRPSSSSRAVRSVSVLESCFCCKNI